MKLRTHTCRAVGCQHVISARMLMCLDHWAMVPAPLQREVGAALRRLQEERSEPALEGYLDAAARAVAAVEEKQERKARGGPSGNLFNA